MREWRISLQNLAEHESWDAVKEYLISIKRIQFWLSLHYMVFWFLLLFSNGQMIQVTSNLKFRHLLILVNNIYSSNDSEFDHLKGRKFRGKKIREIWPNSREKKFLFWPPKMSIREELFNIIQNWWFAKINSREIFQKLIKSEYWRFSVFWIRSSQDHRLFCHFF